MRLILASGSPRRRSLLAGLGFELLVQPPEVDEAILAGEHPEESALRLARKKASVISPHHPVVAADTIVALAEEQFGKPADDAEARRVLARLSGQTHQVWTGWCVRTENEERWGAVSTSVTFRALSQSEIEAYVATGEPADKAGAYAIQGQGGALVDRIEGSYTNVVGLPVTEVLAGLRAVAGEWSPG